MPSPHNHDDNELEYDDHVDEEVDGRVAFPTTFGSRPINAITGLPYPFRLGDPQQLTLFEVRSLTGELDQLGVPAKPGAERSRDPVRLFYDSPKHYLLHRAALLGMGTSDNDVEHMMRSGYGPQTAFDLSNWAEMTRLWKSRQPAQAS